MRKTIEDLYHGNICPSDQVVMEGSEYGEHMKTIVEVEDYLNSVHDAVGKKALETLIDAYNEIITSSSREFFIQGFRLGMRLGVEVMEDDAEGIKDLIASLE